MHHGRAWLAASEGRTSAWHALSPFTLRGGETGRSCKALKDNPRKRRPRVRQAARTLRRCWRWAPAGARRPPRRCSARWPPRPRQCCRAWARRAWWVPRLPRADLHLASFGSGDRGGRARHDAGRCSSFRIRVKLACIVQCTLCLAQAGSLAGTDARMPHPARTAAQLCAVCASTPRGRTPHAAWRSAAMRQGQQRCCSRCVVGSSWLRTPAQAARPLARCCKLRAPQAPCPRRRPSRR